MLHNNPIFIRFCRSNLRVKKAIFWYLLTTITCAFTVAIIYVPQVVRDRDPMDAARAAILPMMIIQGIILLFMGTGSVATGITREKVDNVLNYQRLTPLPIPQKILGYLFGLPVREYVLFGITLPFMAFVLIVGKVSPTAFLPYYLILFTSTLLYHFTGMVAGMISKKWRWSARISQGLIILLYFALPQLSHLGLVFMEFLTVRPVFAENILPVIGPSENIRMDEFGLLAGQDVPFFTLMISGTLFSFMIQSLLIILFATIIARKWKADSVPAINKPMAMITFSAFAIMSLANIWPNLTRSENAIRIFQSDGTLPQAAAVAGLPLILALVTTLLAFVLMVSALPDPQQFRLGRIRAKRQNLNQLPRWDDEANGYTLTTLLFLVQTTLVGIALFTVHRSGYFDGLNSHPFMGLILIGTTGLCLFYFQGLKESFGGGQLGLFALLHWLVPILGAILITAISNGFNPAALFVASLSPIILILLSVTQLIPSEELNEHALTVQRALGFGILLLTVLTLGLHAKLRRDRKDD
ncbi:hypothetical protein G0Q06_04850 [Puniceicoccales bacterium CK1056]|uniref:Uncharacterized protein n=1 Tax=Oceanipulchritudo coccoides TaxID=2706888 RepID=A0A6B2M039_9BACT|nr:hypothetical protein [Oceanipulchritudo coccoides]NDV61772.1 hypothetical protein [Oceanipulchritudo coccoides]